MAEAGGIVYVNGRHRMMANVVLIPRHGAADKAKQRAHDDQHRGQRTENRAESLK